MMRFLVVDDSKVDRQFLSSLLMALGHQVETCENTRGVLEKLQTGNYASLFLDIVMPEQDGYKFLRQLRSNQTTANQYVIIYSNKKTPIEVSYGLKRAGANDYLTKPITREQLQQALQKI